MMNGGSMVWGFCVYFVYMIPLETDVLRKHRFQKHAICLKDYRIRFLSIQYVHGDLCKHLGID